MPGSKSYIWIHAIWSTKYREPLILPAIERELKKSMREQFLKMGCIVGIINGTRDHVHCLFSLSRVQTVAEIIRNVKGGSAFHINRMNCMEDKFKWQDGYAAYSVSKSHFNKVFNYIKHQKRYHRVGDVLEDYENDDFMMLSPLGEIEE